MQPRNGQSWGRTDGHLDGDRPGPNCRNMGTWKIKVTCVGCLGVKARQN